MNDESWFPSDDELRDSKQKLYSRMVRYLYAKHCQQPQAHAEGVCSNSWINALRSLHAVEDSSKFEAWLLKIARNVAHKHLRSCILQERRDGELTEESLLPRARFTNYYESADAAIDIDRMYTYVENISEDLGSIFRLYLEEGLSFEEIGKTLGISKVNARNLFYRTQHKMKIKFNKTNEGQH